MNRLTPEQLAAGVQDLPSLPAVVMELLSSIEQEDIDISVLAKKVSYDQALTAKTLRLANSSTYGLQVKVTTIQQAITFLGFQTTRNLITAAAITGCFPSGRCGGFHDKGFWRHSIATAACARALARRMRFNQDIAFTAGLLHDIGRLVLVTGHPDAYAQVVAWHAQHGGDWQDAEQAILGIDHVDAGVALADHWNFSSTMRQAIAYHHAPDIHGAGFLAAIVHVANAIVHALDLACEDDELVPRVSSVAWDAMGLNEEAYLHLFRETELQFGEMSTILMA
ncbi:HDOD domain-containing protein [Telluria mixta]|uniref:HDOD domain-containing protein n=1 Tax=Telluria mixta TaxID=34071 RepID=A0ABT2C056_9BURK|nr:HDOD domain-containing protein [Telluria mixta]MCS0630587.1 HDOD domain-containing protein [Telluria mixta]WEM98595.1 HDOD domain-containing protein [Telluria mixta]